MKDTNLTTLGLFQEALAQSTPIVPSELKSGDFETTWWTAVPTKLSMPKAPVKTKAKTPPVASKPAKTATDSGDETEEEFETHVNFKVRVWSITVRAMTKTFRHANSAKGQHRLRRHYHRRPSTRPVRRKTTVLKTMRIWMRLPRVRARV